MTRSALPPLAGLRSFYWVVRAGGIAAAAGALNVTPGAIRHQIRLLEAELGEPLLLRGRRDLALTPPGRRLHDSLSRSFGEIETACRTLARPALEGELKLACAPAFAALRLMRILARFSERFPAVTLRLFPIEAADETMDVVIAFGERPIPGARYAILKDERYFPVCSPALAYRSPLRGAEDLRHHALLHAASEEDWQRLFHAHARQPPAARQDIHFPNAYLALQAAKDGCGIAVGSTTLSAEDLRRGTLVRALDWEIPAPYPYFVIQPQQANRALGDVFGEMLRAEIGVE